MIFMVIVLLLSSLFPRRIECSHSEGIDSKVLLGQAVVPTPPITSFFKPPGATLPFSLA